MTDPRYPAPRGLLPVDVKDFVDVTDRLNGVRAGVDFDPAVDLRPGHKLTRDYRGETHEVYVVVPPVRQSPESAARGWDRYWYRGKRHRSLSTIARAITGDPNLNGARFFGLRRRRRGNGRCDGGKR